MKKLITMFISGIAVAFLMSPFAFAQTPDGDTPAEETFCEDNFTGKLNGLCNAFCEATDCDSLNAKASATACAKLQNKINPLLAHYNDGNGTNLEIVMADAVIGQEGNCGTAPPLKLSAPPWCTS